MPLKRARNSEDARPKKKPKRAAPDESEDEEEIDEELLGKFAGRRGLTQEEEEERVLREMAREAGKVEAAETASVMASERAMSEAAASLRPSQRGSQKGSVTSVASSFKQLTSGKWEDLPLPPSIKKALTERFKFEHMTQVQKACIPKALEGMDIVGQAKTGTGKTLAYLVPMAHALLTEGLEDGGLHSLVIVPSREISRQVELVAKKLFTFEKGVRVKRLAGGTWRRQDVPRVNSEDAGSSGKVFDPKHSHITKDYEMLIATPGRLLGLVSIVPQFSAKLKNVKVVAFDECDAMLTDQVWYTIEQLFEHLPPNDHRQTLMYTVAVPDAVNRLVLKMVRPKHLKRFRETTDALLRPVDTVEQTCYVCPMLDMLPLLLRCIRQAQDEHPMDHKVIVFLPTVIIVEAFEDFFAALGMKVLKLHGSSTTTHRQQTVKRIREERRLVVLTSDVLSRGMDFPGVSCVIQYGLPWGVTQYVHRLGRTGRAGAEGKNVLILANFERTFLAKLKHLDINVKEPPFPTKVEEMLVKKAKAKIAGGKYQDRDYGQTVFSSLIAYYSSVRGIKKNKEDLVLLARQFVMWLYTLQKCPAMPQKFIKKYSLQRTPGVTKPERRGVPFQKTQKLKEQRKEAMQTLKKEISSRSETRKAEKLAKKAKATEEGQ